MRRRRLNVGRVHCLNNLLRQTGRLGSSIQRRSSACSHNPPLPRDPRGAGGQSGGHGEDGAEGGADRLPVSR